MDRAGPARLKTVELPRQKYPEACVWQPTSNLLVILVFFVEYTFIGIWVDQYDGGSCPSVRTKKKQLGTVGHDESYLQPQSRLLGSDY